MSLLLDSLHALTKNYDMCVIGSSSVGKSTLILHYVYHHFDESLYDLDAVYTKRIITPDTNGKFREITIFESDFHIDMYTLTRERHVLNANTIVLVYAIDDYQSFTALEDYYERINQLRPLIPISVIASKLDLDTNREVSYYEGAEFAKRIGAVSFNECTRANVMGVNQAFESIANVAVKIQLDKDNTVPTVDNEIQQKENDQDSNITTTPTSTTTQSQTSNYLPQRSLQELIPVNNFTQYDNNPHQVNLNKNQFDVEQNTPLSTLTRESAMLTSNLNGSTPIAQTPSTSSRQRKTRLKQSSGPLAKSSQIHAENKCCIIT